MSQKQNFSNILNLIVRTSSDFTADDFFLFSPDHENGVGRENCTFMS